MKSSTIKLCKYQRKTNYTRQNENSILRLASNLSYDWYLSIWVICILSFLKLCRKYCFTCKSVSKRSCTFITVITEIRTFSLNLCTSNKKFETTKYSQERSFQKIRISRKKIFFGNFSEKHCVLTLNWKRS